MAVLDNISKILEPILLEKTSLFFSRFGAFLSSILLVAVNLLPLYGIFYWGWQPGSIMVLYWLETLMVGVFGVIKLRIAGQKEGALRIIVIYSFVLFVCGVFMLLLSPFIFSTESMGGGILSMVDAVRIALISILAMLISHTYSFFTNFIIGKEWQRLNLNNFMRDADTRIALLMIIVITALLTLSTSVFYVIALVFFKTFMDLGNHLLRHSAGYRKFIKTPAGMIIVGALSLIFVLAYVVIVFGSLSNIMF